MELDRVVKNKKHQPPHHLGQVAVVDVHGVQKNPAKTLTFSAEMCTSLHMPNFTTALQVHRSAGVPECVGAAEETNTRAGNTAVLLPVLLASVLSR